MPNSANSVSNIALLNGSSPVPSSSSSSNPLSQPPPTHPHLHHPTSSSSSSFPKGSFFASAAGAITSPTTAPTKTHRSAEPTSNATNGTNGHAENGGANSGQQPLTLILTVRMLMQGKEVGSIIGKRGDYVRQIRDHSGAKINISDGSCPERIVTISGSSSSINKAFAMVAQKFEEDMQAQQNTSMAKPPVTLRLLVPASQCGSLIGKGGAKIREIRDKTGASLQVASEMLSNSTEKAVTISGSSEALIGCMREVCQILLDAPAKGPTIQYKPVNQAYNPMAVANSAAAIAAAAAAVTAAQHKGMSCGLGTTAAGAGGAFSSQATAAAQLAALLPHTNPTLFSVQEQLALLQQQHNQQQQKQHLLLQHHHPNSNHQFPIDPIVSRFLLQPNAAAAAAAAGLPVSSSASSAAVSNALLANHPSLLISQLQNTVPSQAVATTQKIDALELYGAAAASGLDPATLALLQQQHQAVDAMAMLQQQQIQQQMMLYQHQQQDVGGHENSLSGRAIGSSGKSEKKGSDGTAASSGTTQQQKRFTPY